jgi:molybdopterin-guanine dinucleotide biosynthesis protein A
MHSAAILAGGRASRFDGCDKGALMVDGRTIRDRQLRLLSRVADDVLIVGGPAGHVADVIPDSGPLGGVHSALMHARHDAVFVVACDMPYVTEPLVRFLLELAATADIVLPRTASGYHPLCAVYTRACIAPIERRLAARELKMIDLLADVRARVVTGDEIAECGDVDRLLANVNTPSDYAALESFRALQNHKL